MSHNNIETTEPEQINTQIKSLFKRWQESTEIVNKLFKELSDENNDKFIHIIDELKDIIDMLYAKYLEMADKVRESYAYNEKLNEKLFDDKEVLFAGKENDFNRIIELQTQIFGLRDEAITIKAQNEALATENEGLKAKVNDFDTNINAINFENEKLKTENEELKAIYKKIEADSILSKQFNFLKQNK